VGEGGAEAEEGVFCGVVVVDYISVSLEEMMEKKREVLL
jgi:hypothetical protein